ncbi:MAG: transcription-repair coupling factor [Eubacteriaceae bacterium]|nr:transcription-repair coupling factor [Eubacteriaceae bacterium]
MASVNISGISDSRAAAAAGKIINEHDGQWIVVTPTFAGAGRMAADLSFFVKKKIYVLPADNETFLSYEAKNKDTLMGRLEVFRALLSGENCVVVAPMAGVVKKLPPAELFASAGFSLKKGREADIKDTLKRLVDMGYERVPMTYAPGQFALRGEILDIFTPYSDVPVRIEFFDVEVESIRTFDPATQRSISDIDDIYIYPAELLIREERSFERAKKKIEKAYSGLEDRKEQLLESIDQMSNLQHLENYFDYFYETPEHIWDYVKGPVRIITDDPNRCWENLEAAVKEFKVDFEVYLEQGRIISADYKNFPSTKDLKEMYNAGDTWHLTPFARKIKGVDHLDGMSALQSRQTLSYNGKMDILERDLEKYLEHGYKVTIVCSSDERTKNMEEFLSRTELRRRVWVESGYLSAGMEFPEEKICYITDGDIFGTRKKKRRKQIASSKNARPIKSFSEIGVGDFVVHESHGIGKFEGMEQLTVKGEIKDYLKVKYAGGDMLYVPAEQMDLIQKYVGADSASPKINKLAGSEWRTTKAKAKAGIANMAKELLEISAAREAALGYAFGADTVWQKEFEESFPYEETPDQLRCIEEIKQDMEKPKVMDRLLCGDVGYGKTEVAARAMFKCAAEGKQVALLVPTTVLASQHFYTLSDRFEKFPFKIEMISRFKSAKEQKEIIKGLGSGAVDIVIGTHRLLSSDVKFKDLGLLVIDEEQRFGVAHKEKIKTLKKNIDVLTLSATPIPRTLHMSLLGIRDMSLIEEPPEERYPVQTYVMEEDSYVIREAIQRELDRGGQVYVIHNRVNGIQRLAENIYKLVPDSRILVGHGRMNETELEDVMMTFIEGDADILVATTIIENGIDIPNANTVIVIDADKFGLSQLYQLRGRVGRSSRLAYAYLMHRSGKVLSSVAEKRLRAIKDFTEFGAGFKIAMRDLEIRGAGNLLGGEQHGHMVNVGYELYCKMVEDAVRGLKGENLREEREEAVIDVDISAYIPDRYISDEITKLSMYKEIADVADEGDEKNITDELTDRFGSVPAETKNLIMISRIKTLAEDMDIRKADVKRDKIVLTFNKKAMIKPQTIFLEKPGNPLREVIRVLSAMAK